MLDDYQKDQPIIYKILKNQIVKEKNSHAYLFETNGYYDSQKFIKAFIKSLLCPNKYLNKEKCNNCHQCEVIEAGNFPEIKIINPDGLWIKKEQLQELQNEFNEKAIIGTKRIYIINGAEKLNKSAANSILKFLEEPEGNIIAILITENVYGVLETIRSRCQILRLKESSIENTNSQIDKIKKILNIDLEEELINKIIEFVDYYEAHHINTILYMNKIWNEFIKTKDNMITAFDIMIIYYKDILNYKITNKLEIFKETNEIKKIIENNKINDLCNKINLIAKQKQNIKYNANINLLMDKLIIELEGGL